MSITDITVYRKQKANRKMIGHAIRVVRHDDKPVACPKCGAAIHHIEVQVATGLAKYNECPACNWQSEMVVGAV